MLIKDEKRILKTIISICKSYKPRLPDDIPYACSLEVHTRLYPKYPNNSQLIYDNLIKKEYISNHNNNRDEFELAYQGKYYYELKRLKFKALLVNSIFLPSVLAIITTVITLWLTGYFE